MLYTRFTLENMPQIVFAHIYSCPGYKANFKQMAPNIEIAYIKAGKLTVEAPGMNFVAEENGFLILPHNYTFKATAAKDEPHIHYTISAMIDEHCSLTESMEITGKNELCLPIYISANPKSEELANILYEAISMYQNGEHVSVIKSGTIAARLLCELEEASKISEIKPSKKLDMLSGRIKAYIARNISSPITLSDIGDALGKNPNYLNTVFKKQNHMSIIAYSNLMKMRHVAVLIVDKGYSVRKAAEAVGIKDVNYLSRLFKQKMGMNISDYKDNSVDYTFDFADKDKIQ